MITFIVLTTILPFFYLLGAALTARKIYYDASMRLQQRKHYNLHKDKYYTAWDKEARINWGISAVILGSLWPVSFPFYLALLIPPKNERVQLRKKAAEMALERAERELAEATRKLHPDG